jgi:hypothetical protein
MNSRLERPWDDKTMSENDRKTPPPLIPLPVCRSAFCDQQTTDGVLQHLWQNKPDFIAALAEEEKWLFPDCRDGGFRQACYAIEEFLRAHESEAIGRVDADLAVLDILHETSRRIRKALGLCDIPAFGKPLAAGPRSRLPELISIKITGDDDYRSVTPMTQEMADKVCALLYQREPTWHTNSPSKEGTASILTLLMDDSNCHLQKSRLPKTLHPSMDLDRNFYPVWTACARCPPTKKCAPCLRHRRAAAERRAFDRSCLLPCPAPARRAFQFHDLADSPHEHAT